MTAPANDPREEQDPYALIAEWYDLEHDSFTDDIELYQELLAGETQRLAILEVGAGKEAQFLSPTAHKNLPS